VCITNSAIECQIAAYGSEKLFLNARNVIFEILLCKISKITFRAFIPSFSSGEAAAIAEFVIHPNDTLKTNN
jgi:hypothetical protein